MNKKAISWKGKLSDDVDDNDDVADDATVSNNQNEWCENGLKKEMNEEENEMNQPGTRRG
jgi:hypothetical protein